MLARSPADVARPSLAARYTRADHPLMFWINLPFTALPFPQIELQGLGAMNKRAAGAQDDQRSGSHNLRNRAALLLTIPVVIFFVALRRSPTPNHLLMMIVLVGALCVVDFVNTLRTGRAKTRMNGTATREHRPTIFWKYIYGGYAFLTLCVIGFFSVILWPGFFR